MDEHQRPEWSPGDADRTYPMPGGPGGQGPDPAGPGQQQGGQPPAPSWPPAPDQSTAPQPPSTPPSSSTSHPPAPQPAPQPVPPGTPGYPPAPASAPPGTPGYPPAPQPAPPGAPGYPQAPGTLSFPAAPQPGYPAAAGQPGAPGYPPAPQSAPPGYESPGQPGVPGYPPASGPGYPPAGPGLPGAGAPPKKRRVGLIAAIVAAVALLLCAVGGTGAYVLVNRLDGRGQATPDQAVDLFLKAVFTDHDAARANKYVCREARDEKALKKKIDELKRYDEKFDSPDYRWATPTVQRKGAKAADVKVDLTVRTDDDRAAKRTLTFLAVERSGWWVCEIKDAPTAK